MIWDILIITKDYDKYVEYFRNKKEFIDNWRESKFETNITSGFINIDIIKYSDSFSGFRGRKVDILYVDDEIFNNPDMNIVLLPCVIKGKLLPITYLNTRL